MSEHTPGPWFVGEVNCGDGRNVITATGLRVCHTARIFWDGKEILSRREADANARLIAAVPDLLAAAKALLDDGVSIGRIDALRAAVEKAEGSA